MCKFSTISKSTCVMKLKQNTSMEDKFGKGVGIDKNVMVELLIKLELEKMGFKEKDYQAALREFLGKFSVE